MTDWPVVQLGEISPLIDYGFTASATQEPVGPKFLRITDIQDGIVNWETVPYCNRPVNGSIARLSPGDIVFARTGATTGKSFLITSCPETAIFASYLIRVRPGDMIVPSYLAHFFSTPSYWSQIALGARGAAQLGVNASTLRMLKIPLPPLDEQRRIAAILDAADSLSAKRRAALAKLDQLAQSIFIQMFGDPVSNPKGWPSDLTLGEIADIVSGITKGRKLNGHSVRTIPYLAVLNVQDRRLNLDVVKRIEATDAEIARYRLQRDDLLLTEGGDPDKLGRGTLWSDELPECIHQNHVFRVRLQSKEIAPLFLNWLVGSQRGKKYFLRSAKQTTGIASINMTQLRGFPLLAPPVKLQNEFAERISGLQTLRSQSEHGMAGLTHLFSSLQHRAFRGEL